MSRWIDAEWLLNFFEPYPNDYQTPLGSLRACVDDAPSIDIVRCKECKYYNARYYECECDWASTDHEGGASYSLDRNPDDFCSYGERSEP